MSERLNEFFGSVFTIEDTSNIPVLRQETSVKLENVVFTRNIIREKINKLKTNYQQENAFIYIYKDFKFDII